MTFKHEKPIVPVIWVVVADRSRARILSADWPEPSEWTEAADMLHAEGALKESEVKTDGPGTFGEAAGGHHGGQPQTDFKHQTAERFADEILAKLEEGRVKNQFGKLGLVCPPLFLGVVRNKLSSQLGQMVTLELGKDYTHVKFKDICAHLNSELASA